MKLLTEFTTAAPALATVAISPDEGLELSPPMALLNAVTEDWIALVSLGKSLLAELTRAVASLSILLAWDLSALAPLLAFKLVRPWMELCRLLRSVQYDGLLLPQPASATSPTVAMPRARGVHFGVLRFMALMFSIMFANLKLGR
jgi:hypothetical protein